MVEGPDSPSATQPSRLLLFAAAAGGALVAVALFSFAVSHAVLLPAAGADPIERLAVDPRIELEVGHPDQPKRLNSETSSVMAGGAQRVEVSVVGGCLEPNYIAVRAGVPIELHVPDGDQASARILMEKRTYVLDTIRADSVRLPALTPGVHPFGCTSDRVDGVIVAR